MDEPCPFCKRPPRVIVLRKGQELLHCPYLGCAGNACIATRDQWNYRYYKEGKNMDAEDKEFIEKLISKYMGLAGAFNPIKNSKEVVQEIEKYFYVTAKEE